MLDLARGQVEHMPLLASEEALEERGRCRESVNLDSGLD